MCDPVSKDTFENVYMQKVPDCLRSPMERGLHLDVYSDEKCCSLRDAIVSAMDAHTVDVIVYPTWNDPPSPIGEFKSPADGNNSAAFVPHTGMPSLTVPMGYTGLDGAWPAGLQMVARPFAEDVLFRSAYGYEQGTLHRKPPKAFVGTQLNLPVMPLLGPLIVANGDRWPPQ
jgi:Asp-tRNA(Asn)/Glu-tRNA(Gln) amidotransferase A subunit family amidase